MTATNAFLDAITDLDTLFGTDRDTAAARFADTLTLAGPEDRDFLDDLVRTFTTHPYPRAMALLEQRYENEPQHRDRLAHLVPDTDPGLYVRDHAERAAVLAQHATGAARQVSLAAAELPRQSIRLWRNPPARTYLAPSRAIDKSRLAPARLAARVWARGKRRPAAIEPDLVTTYVADHLYVDIMARELADAATTEKRRVERGLLTPSTPSEPTPRLPGDKPPVDADLAREGWDHQYVAYVAEQHHRAHALTGRKPVSEADALAAADARTTLRGDRRTPIPFQGNGLDYDHEAMNPVSGWRCVSCFVERAVAEQHILHTRAGQVRSDDGLCDMCRTDEGCPRLPALSAGFTPRDLARAYCEFLTSTYPAAAASLLAEVRRRVPRWLIGVLDEFRTDSVDSEPRADGSATPPAARPHRQRGPLIGAGQRRGRCEGCTRVTVVNDSDGFCSECRVWLGLVTAAPRQPAAA